MTEPVRVIIRIGNLRVQGATQADAQALASALRETLATHLAAQQAADPSLLLGAGAENLGVTLPPLPSGQPAALGQAAGEQIASALAVRKGDTS